MAVKRLEMQINTQQLTKNLNSDDLLVQTVAAARQKFLDPQNCLSCGEPEVKQVKNSGLVGLHFRDRYTRDIDSSP